MAPAFETEEHNSMAMYWTLIASQILYEHAFNFPYFSNQTSVEWKSPCRSAATYMDGPPAVRSNQLWCINLSMVVNRVMASSSLQLLTNWKSLTILCQAWLSSMQYGPGKEKGNKMGKILWKGFNGIEEAFKLYFTCNQLVVQYCLLRTTDHK